MRQKEVATPQALYRSLGITLVLSVPGLLCTAREPAAEPASRAQSTATPSGEIPIFGSGVETVMLDLVVRDRDGEIVRNLRADEIEVYEDGVRQKITAFNDGETAAAALPEPGAPQASSTMGPAAGARRPKIVVLVFDQLSIDGRHLASQAATDFVGSYVDPETYVAVFRVDQRLRLVQTFTRDAQRLKQAIETATLPSSAPFSSRLGQLSSELPGSRSGGDPLQAGHEPEDFRPEHFPGDPDAGKLMDGEGSDAARKSFAEAAVNALRLAEGIERELRASWSLYGLLALVNVQQTLTGRKTLLYFSEGLHVPAGYDDALRSLISAANRSNVSVYSVDVRGLTGARQMETARQALNQLAAVSRSQRLSASGGGGQRPVTREQLLQQESLEAAMRMDLQGTLGNLATSTGGFLLANSNDMKSGLARLANEIRHYYEVGYAPSNGRLDGKFRKIRVKVARSGVSVQAREGYYAVPHKAGTPVLGHQIPLFAALAAQKLPRDIDEHAKVFHFGVSAGRVQQAIVVDVPLARLSFSEDSGAQRFSGHISILALVRDSAGNILEQLSQDYPLGGTLSQLREAKKSHITFVRHFALPPGEYLLETGVRDHLSGRIGASRGALSVVAPPAGVVVSSVAVVAGVEPASGGAKEMSDPLLFESLQVTPAVSGTVRREPGKDELALYNIVYPQADPDETPRLTVELLRAGKVVVRGNPALPHADPHGRIKHLVTLPATPLTPGEYDVRFTVTQGRSTAVEQTHITIEPPATNNKPRS